MKVLFIMHNTNVFSGANLAMQEVIEDLQKDNSMQISVLLPDSKGNALSYYKELGIPVFVTKYWISMFNSKDSFLKQIVDYIALLFRSLFMILNCLRLKSAVKDIDIIYTNTCTLQIGLWLSLIYNKKHIWHIREFGDKDHGLKYPFGKKLYFYIANHINNITITISESLYKERKPFFRNIVYIYDDVSSNYINECINKKNNKPLNVLVAGDIKEGKGQFEVVKAIDKCMKNNIELNLYIAGKVSDINYKKLIDKFIVDNKLENNVFFLGHISDMNKLRTKMDIGVVASQMEAFGRVTIEGMLSCLAMIGINKGCTPELIDDNSTGLIYDGSPSDLASKIATLADTETRLRIAKSGYLYAVDTFTKSKCSSRIDGIIQSISNSTR